MKEAILLQHYTIFYFTNKGSLLENELSSFDQHCVQRQRNYKVGQQIEHEHSVKPKMQSTGYSLLSGT